MEAKQLDGIVESLRNLKYDYQEVVKTKNSLRTNRKEF